MQRAIVVIGASVAVGSALSAVVQAQAIPATWPTHLPVGMAGSLASALVAIVGSWAALRYGLRSAVAQADEARRRADAAHRRVSEVNSEVVKIRLELRGVSATMAEFQSSMRSDVADLRAALVEERHALDASQRQIVERLDSLMREGCGRASICS